MELPPLPPSVALPHPSLATHSTPPRHHGWTVAALATAWKLAPTRQATRRWAVVEDEHCQAVGAWLRNFVIAKDFCPWAKPAKKKDHIRIVSSTARASEAVLGDLLDEAEALPLVASGETGETTTTLLVCPYVEEWKAFGPFRDFYEEDLEGGSTFLEDFDMKIVAFHPEYLKYGFSVAAGDRIAVANFDGTSSSATVLDEEGGVHPEDGEELLDVRFDNGEEFLIRYSSIITKLAMKDGQELPANDATGDAANLLSRAPRPTLHLLRMEDLEAASLAAKAKTGPDIQQVLEANAERAAAIGLDGMSEVLRDCS